VRDQPSHERVAVPLRLFRSESDRREMNVGVRTLFVRVGVVTGVFVTPPAIADPDQQIRNNQADPVVPLSRLEDLPVSRIVAEEGGLRQHTRQDGCGDQLPPAVTRFHKHEDDCRQRCQQAKHFRPVVAVTTTHQTRGMNAVRQGGELTDGSVDFRFWSASTREATCTDRTERRRCRRKEGW